MSEDVRKQLRTQGRYSDKGLHTDDKGHHKHREKRQKVSPVTKVKSEEKVIKRNSNGGKDTDNSLMDDSLSPVVKYEEKSPYAFSQLDEKKPIEIMDRGKRVLSSTENGESIIYYEPQFLSEGVGNDYFEYLEGTIAWHSKNIVIQGNEYPQPRLVAWFGPFPYSYSGTTLEPAEMPDKILEIKRRVEIYLEKKGINATFNSVLLNLYRNGKDSVSWHSDDELTMGISPTIASVSLGETRKFEMRKKMKYLQYEDEESSNQTDKYFVHLTHGSLLIMTGCMQDDWQHRVPKEYHDKSARINLTFRTVHRLERVIYRRQGKHFRKRRSEFYTWNETPKRKKINSCRENFKSSDDNLRAWCSGTSNESHSLFPDDTESNGSVISNEYKDLQLEHLLDYNVDLMQSQELIDYASALRKKVLQNALERQNPELQFLCRLVKETRMEERKKLITKRMQNVVSSTLEMHQTSDFRKSLLSEVSEAIQGSKTPAVTVREESDCYDEQEVKDDNNENRYIDFQLEELLCYDSDFMHGRTLSDYVLALKSKILEKIPECTHQEREKLQLLCDYLTGTKVEKTQKLLIKIMLGIVNGNILKRNAAPKSESL